MQNALHKIGRASIDIKELIAGSSAIWTIVYETGGFGVDDSGEILLARRDVCDSDIPQFDDPKKAGYVRVFSDTKCKLKVQYIPDRYIRPWKSCISIRISDGSLEPGDKVYIKFGASYGEGPGYRIQTFAEQEHLFKVLVDCAGSGNFYEVIDSPHITVSGGYLSKAEAVLPSIVKCGDLFDITLRALDSWGNIAEQFNGDLYLVLNNIKHKVLLINGIGKIGNYFFEQEGLYFSKISNDDGEIIGDGNPVRCLSKETGRKLYWGDMHGQTKETVGTGTPDLYFGFARDKSILDFSAWQGNDFQVTDDTWKNVCETTQRYHDPGKFVTFLGYEWSGTTPVGGDHNIYFLNDFQPIHRSYFWQIGMENGDGSDRSPISALWEEFKDRDDVMGIPHVGGRYGNLDYCNDEFVSLLEIHSHHGTFEWFFEDALRKGLKLGIVAASDDHTCRPGLSYPTRVTSRGFVSFDVIGGYTGVYAEKLTRESLWEAFKSRHCYGTTGQRILLEVSCMDKMMGDELNVSDIPEICVHTIGTDVISQVEVRRGLDTVYKYSDTLPLNKNRLKIQWSGVRVRSRSKKTNWDGRLIIQNGSVKNVEQFAFNQPDEGVTLISNQIVEWKSNTSGDIDGFEVDIEYDDSTVLNFSSGPAAFSLSMDELKKGPVIKDAGGVNQKVEIGFARVESQQDVEFVFKDVEVKEGLNPYWVKVVQKDGHMAWSSPVYVNYKRR